MEKIYCKNCKYLKHVNSRRCCFKTKEIIGNIYSGEDKVMYTHCNNINKNGECGDYRKKWYKFWLK